MRKLRSVLRIFFIDDTQYNRTSFELINVKYFGYLTGTHIAVVEG